MKFLFFSLFAAVIITTCYGYGYLSSLTFDSGDKVACRLKGVKKFIQSKHWFLAANSEELIHIVGDDDEGYVLKEKKGRIDSDKFDVKKCKNEGRGKHGAEAVSRALPMVGTKTEYSKLTCNSKDYVDFWADGDQICKVMLG